VAHGDRYGLGSEETVRPNKTEIKLIANNTDNDTLVYFAFDSGAKKSGRLTILNLRFRPQQIKAPYLVEKAEYMGIRKDSYIHNYDICTNLKQNRTLVMTYQYGTADADEHIPERMKHRLAIKSAKRCLIIAAKVRTRGAVGGCVRASSDVSSGAREAREAREARGAGG